MRSDDQLVVKTVLTLRDVVQVDVAEFVNFVAQMPLLDERHFHDQRFGLVKDRIVVQTLAGRVAKIRDFGDFDLVRNVGPFLFQAADLLSRQIEKFRLEFLSPTVHDVPQRIDPVRRGEGFHDQFLRKLHRIAAFQAYQLAWEFPVVELRPDVKQPGGLIDEFFRKVNHWRGNFHHATPGDVAGKHRQVVQMRMRDEPVRGPHELPRLRAKVESKAELGNVPEGLNRGAGKTLNGVGFEFKGLEWNVFHVFRRASGKVSKRKKGLESFALFYIKTGFLKGGPMNLKFLVHPAEYRTSQCCLRCSAPMRYSTFFSLKTLRTSRTLREFFYHAFVRFAVQPGNYLTQSSQSPQSFKGNSQNSPIYKNSKSSEFEILLIL